MLYIMLAGVLLSIFLIYDYYEGEITEQKLNKARKEIEGPYKIIDLYSELYTEHYLGSAGVYSSLREKYFLTCCRLTDNTIVKTTYSVLPRYDCSNNKYQHFKIGDIVNLTFNEYYEFVVDKGRYSKKKLNCVLGN